MADRLDIQLISAALRRLGWIRFWAQVVLAVVVMGVLLFNNIGGQIAGRTDRALGLAPGLSLTSLAFFVLLWCLWQGWLIIRCGRAIDSPTRPSRGEAARLIFCRLMLQKPNFLMLDEPTSVLTPAEADDPARIILRVANPASGLSLRFDFTSAPTWARMSLAAPLGTSSVL